MAGPPRRIGRSGARRSTPPSIAPGVTAGPSCSHPPHPATPLTGPVAAEQARERAAGLAPQPYAPDRKALAATLERELGGKTDYSVVWLSDGLDYGEGPAFAESLTKLAGGSGSILTCSARTGTMRRLALDQATGDGSELAARVLSGAEGPRSGVVKALTGRGEPLGEAPFRYPARRARSQARISICHSKSAIRSRGWRSRASDRPAPCISSMPARSGAGSASSRANRGRPRSPCSRRSTMSSARSRPTPTS